MLRRHSNDTPRPKKLREIFTNSKQSIVNATSKESTHFLASRNRRNSQKKTLCRLNKRAHSKKTDRNEKAARAHKINKALKTTGAARGAGPRPQEKYVSIFGCQLVLMAASAVTKL